jgi:uncharacterized membrane protein
MQSNKFWLASIAMCIVLVPAVFAASFEGIGKPSGSAFLRPVGVSTGSIIAGGNWEWQNGVYSTISGLSGTSGIGAISNDGKIMIASGSGNGNAFYIVTNGTATQVSGYPGATLTFPYSISGNGSQIVGGTRQGVPWIYQNGSYKTLGLPSGYIYGDAQAISDDGSIVSGQITASSGAGNAAIWKDNGVEALPNHAGAMGAEVWDISGDGSTVVGNYYDSSNNDGHACGKMARKWIYQC